MKHEFYVYHEENRVMARMGKQAPVVAEKCKTFQEAHDKAQAILNPTGRDAASFGHLGFLSPEFQAAISGNCEAYVRAAYSK